MQAHQPVEQPRACPCEAAERELSLFFPEGLVDYDYAAYNWIYDPVEELKK